MTGAAPAAGPEIITVGRIGAGRLLCSDAMPSLAEIELALGAELPRA